MLILKMPVLKVESGIENKYKYKGKGNKKTKKISIFAVIENELR